MVSGPRLDGGRWVQGQRADTCIKCDGVQSSQAILCLKMKRLVMSHCVEKDRLTDSHVDSLECLHSAGW